MCWLAGLQVVSILSTSSGFHSHDRTLGVNFVLFPSDRLLNALSFKFSVATWSESLSPVEWTITPSSKWSASVAVMRFSSSRRWPLGRRTLRKELVSEMIRSNCKSPEELYLALSRAQVVALFPELRYRILHSASKAELRSDLLLSALSLRKSPSAIYVHIQLPIRLHHAINIVDLPETLLGVDGVHSHMLTEYYLTDQRRAIQCFRASDKPGDEAWITSYVKFHKVSTAWKVYSCSSSVEATMDQLRVIDQSNADPLNPSSFLFYLNDDMITGEVFDADDALNLRKAESAFFQIVPPWPELRNRQSTLKAGSSYLSLPWIGNDSEDDTMVVCVDKCSKRLNWYNKRELEESIDDDGNDG
ncbi:hypothetical protein CPB83DRAFT_838692 [Crepidotus variabilis]|uniref:Uncharacterized protein n=1 Tax=Crepidotus variabilis TaxID=179855 RepID=A0A9P6JLF9_9AGAR|nr:hypothetical protein CPB83DRAFT_838692 [Crepidotus variabilis]